MFLKDWKITGLYLAIIVILLFLIVGNFFVNENYYKLTLIINGFIIPSIFVGFSLWLLLNLQKKHPLSFRFAFKNAYLAMFLGGSLSLIFIFIYMNFLDVELRNIFHYQLYDTLFIKAKEDIHAQEIQDTLSFEGLDKEQSKIRAKELLDSLQQKRDTQNPNLFNLKEGATLALIFGINLFYLIISFILSLFLRSKNTIQ